MRALRSGRAGAGRGDAMRLELSEGLSRAQKELSPKWFYDRRGSELFEEITRLPEYYPTRSERALLERCVPDWVRRLEPASLVELGAGAAEKTRILLDAMTRRPEPPVYVPVDISAEFLEQIVAGLRTEYPDARVEPLTADIAAALPLPDDLPRPALFAFLGGTIGNFAGASAVGVLRRVRERMRPDDRLILGADLEKPVAVLEAAYNDAAGVTSEFNLNALRVINRKLGADFDVAAFRHHAFYNATARRIEMHLVARRPVTATIPGAGSFQLAAGESIRTEISCKYDRASIESLLDRGGLQLEEWVVGEPGFALSLARPR